MAKMTYKEAIAILKKVYVFYNADIPNTTPEQVRDALFTAEEALYSKIFDEEGKKNTSASTKVTASDDECMWCDSGFFTRDDAIEYIEIPLEEKIRESLDIMPDEFVSLRCYIEDNKLEVDFDIAGDIQSTTSTTIDFRKIKKPSDLQKYVSVLLDDISRQYVDCCGGAVEGSTKIEASTGSRCDKVLQAFHNNEDIDEDTYIQADTEVEFSNGFTETVDTIFLVYEPRYNKYPRFKGFAHTPKGGYDWDYVDVYDITNFDLDEYMDGINIIDLEKMLADHPEIFDI